MKITDSSKEYTCAVLEVLTIIGGKWRIPILWRLAQAQTPLRYNELKRQLDGITNIMLTRSLREMEEKDLIFRKVHHAIPPHVEYSLSTQAKKLIPALELVNQWGQEWLEKTESAKK
jgi:Predicted transcriptional regulators